MHIPDTARWLPDLESAWCPEDEAPPRAFLLGDRRSVQDPEPVQAGNLARAVAAHAKKRRRDSVEPRSQGIISALKSYRHHAVPGITDVPVGKLSRRCLFLPWRRRSVLEPEHFPVFPNYCLPRVTFVHPCLLSGSI